MQRDLEKNVLRSSSNLHPDPPPLLSSYSSFPFPLTSSCVSLFLLSILFPLSQSPFALRYCPSFLLPFLLLYPPTLLLYSSSFRVLDCLTSPPLLLLSVSLPLSSVFLCHALLFSPIPLSSCFSIFVLSSFLLSLSHLHFFVPFLLTFLVRLFRFSFLSYSLSSFVSLPPLCLLPQLLSLLSFLLFPPSCSVCLPPSRFLLSYNESTFLLSSSFLDLRFFLPCFSVSTSLPLF